MAFICPHNVDNDFIMKKGDIDPSWCQAYLSTTPGIAEDTCRLCGCYVISSSTCSSICSPDLEVLASLHFCHHNKDINVRTVVTILFFHSVLACQPAHHHASSMLPAGKNPSTNAVTMLQSRGPSDPIKQWSHNDRLSDRLWVLSKQHGVSDPLSYVVLFLRSYHQGSLHIVQSPPSPHR